MIGIYAVALVAALAGFLAGWRGVQRARQPATGPQVLLQWREDPPSAWGEDPMTGLFITLHSGTVFALAILLLLHLWRAWPGASLALEYLVAIGGVGLVALSCGLLLALPAGRRLIHPVTIGITAAGPLEGQYAGSWTALSHWQADPARRQIRLYNAGLPGLARLVWHPPDPAVFQQACTLLDQFLPAAPPTRTLAWYQHRHVLLGLLLLITLPFLVIGLVIYGVALPWTWLYYIGAAFTVQMLGLLLLNRYALG